MKAVLIGYGEVGQGVHKVYRKQNDIDIHDKEKNITAMGEYEVMLVAIPYTDDFIDIVNAYQEKFKPEATIIFSTVPIGTTSKFKNAVHSPVEGKHPDLEKSIRLMTRWIGGFNLTAYNFIKTVTTDIKIADKPEYTEFLKLQSTSNYGLMIEYARYVNTVCKKVGMDYKYVKEFNKDYNKLYKDLNMPQFQRYILDPPKGRIGGHCIVPNSVILDKEYPSMFLKKIYRRDIR